MLYFIVNFLPQAVLYKAKVLFTKIFMLLNVSNQVKYIYIFTYIYFILRNI